MSNCAVSVDIGAHFALPAREKLKPPPTHAAATAVWKARQSFDLGRTSSLAFRRRQLQQLALMYREQETALLEALRHDLGKPRMEAILFELEFVKNDLVNVRANFESWLRPVNRYVRLFEIFAQPQVYRDAYGVVLIVGVWNYPVQSTLLPLASAIAAGNCVVLKPPPEAARTSRLLQDLLPAYLDDLSYIVLTDTEKYHEVKFDYVFYTGGLDEAKRLHGACSRHLTPATFVVGGKNPVYIDDSADIEMTVRRIIWGKCINAGQTCIGPGYILCTKDVMHRFLELVPRVMEEFYGSEPHLSPDYTRIISKDHFERLVASLKGKDIAYGGANDATTLYMQLTLVTNISPNDSLLHDETYGPILPIVHVSDANEAVAFIRAREKPLALYIFAKDSQLVEMMLQRTSSGGVTVNDVLLHIAAESLPFGGVGLSGMGAYHGKATFDTFSHEKSVLKKSLNSLVGKLEAIKYPPYNSKKEFIATQLMKRRRFISFGWIRYFTIFLFGIAVGILLEVFFQ